MDGQQQQQQQGVDWFDWARQMMDSSQQGVKRPIDWSRQMVADDGSARCGAVARARHACDACDEAVVFFVHAQDTRSHAARNQNQTRSGSCTNEGARVVPFGTDEAG